MQEGWPGSCLCGDFSWSIATKGDTCWLAVPWHQLSEGIERSAEFIPVTDRLHLFLRYDRLSLQEKITPGQSLLYSAETLYLFRQSMRSSGSCLYLSQI